MTVLHTVNKSPYERDSLEACLRLAEKGSSVLLIEDAVYAAVNDSVASEILAQAMQRVSVYVLGPDLRARGLQQSRLLEGVKDVEYRGFVRLVTEHKGVQSWL
ncbi:MAG: sulfurtransferase complex subunit TusB [Gammaproteobacteria bacterium]